MTQHIYDLIVVGGGINGCGIAADASGRGLSVALFESEDLASATSSASSKLLHGGLRYLENYEFRLVKEGLTEREIILKMAPHVVFPLKFHLPHRSYLRPSWMIRAGLFLYDNLSKSSSLPGSSKVNFSKTGPLKSDITKGYEYYDAWMDDARMVVLNARLAQQKGAEIYTQAKVTKAQRVNDIWHITVHNEQSGHERVYFSRGLVNATGPWVKEFYDVMPQESASRTVRLVKGSHIIVHELYDEKNAYILQNEDKRIVFVIPYLNKFSLIGTTDIDFTGDPRKASIDKEEISYLLSVINNHFKYQLKEKDIIASYSGIRPLSDEKNDKTAQKASRDYTLTLSDQAGKAPLVSVFGGKLTTYRKLSEATVDRLKPYYPQATGHWTATAKLPGGDIPSIDEYRQLLLQRYPWISSTLATRFIQTYGSESETILANATCFEDMGQHYGSEFTEAELDYLVKFEWVKALDDVIKRRTKLYLFLSDTQKKEISKAIKNKKSLKAV